MKQKNILYKISLFVLCLKLVSCSKGEGYTNFESFNYFTLKGVNQLEEMFPSKPYVSLKQGKDTFMLKKYYDDCDVATEKWIKKSGFWYSENTVIRGTVDPSDKSEANIEKTYSYLFNDSLLIFRNTFVLSDSSLIMSKVTIKKNQSKYFFYLSNEIQPSKSISFDSLLKLADGDYRISFDDLNNDTLIVFETEFSQGMKDCYETRYLMNGISPFYLDDDCVQNQIKFLGRKKTPCSGASL